MFHNYIYSVLHRKEKKSFLTQYGSEQMIFIG